MTRARNNCVAQFLANPQWTHLFWIDSDIGFSAQAAFRLLLSNYDIAAGVYPLKRDNWPAEGVVAGTTQQQFEANFTRYTVNAKVSEITSKVELEVQPDGFMKMEEAPTGFMVIKRAVFERLIASYPEYNYVPDSIGEATWACTTASSTSWSTRKRDATSRKTTVSAGCGRGLASRSTSTPTRT